jgi:hypothetical protein
MEPSAAYCPGCGGASNGSAWLADPTLRHQLRFHDGTRWTEHVSDHGVQAVDPA